MAVKSGSKKKAVRNRRTAGAEEISHHSEEQFRILAEEAPVLLWVNGLEGGEFVNRAYLEFLGVSGQVDIQHYDWSQYVHPDDREGYLSKYLECFSRQAPFEAQFRFRRYDGEYRWMKSVGRPRFTSEGQFIGYVGSTQDITDIKLAEEELHRSRDELEQRVRERTVELQQLNDDLTTQIEERRRAEEGEERLGVLMDHNPSLVFMKDESGRYVYLNNAYEKQFVLSSNWFGKTDFDFWPKESAELFRANDAEVLRSGRTHQFIEDSADLTGKRYCWLNYKFPFTDSNGNKYVGGIGIDVTDRIKAEEALRASEEKFRLFADSTYDWESWIDSEANFIYVSPSCERITGYSPEEFYRDPKLVFKLVHTNDLEAYTRHRDVHFSNAPGSDQIDFRIITKGGETRWMSHRCQAVFGSDGKWLGRRGSNQDFTERKLAEEALRESEEKFRNLADNIPNSAWMADADGTFYWYNKQWYDYTGTTPEEMQGWGWQKVHHPDYIESVTEEWKSKLKSGQFFEKIFPMRGKDGDYRWFLTRAVPIKDANGKVVRWLGTNTDITERRRAEEALLDSDFRLRLALEAGELGWHDYRPLTGEVLWDKNCRAIWGLGLDDHVDINVFWAGIHPSSEAETKQKLDAAIDPRGDGIFDMEYLVRPLDGSPDRWVHATGRTMFEGEGASRRSVRLIGTVQDITESKRAEQALREREARQKVAEVLETERQRLFGVLETIPAMVCLLTPDYHVAFANRSFQERFGESQGRHCYEYCFGKTGPCEFCESFVPLKTGQPHNWEVHGPDGSVIEAHDYPFTDVDGSPMVLEMDIDVTERKKAEAELEIYRKHLETLVKERTEMLQEAKEQAELYLDLMGHDISNMHQIILGQLQLAEDIMNEGGKLDSADKELIEVSIKNLLRSAKLIDNVKNLQRLQTGDYSKVPTDLGMILDDAVATYSGLPEKKVTIDYRPVKGYVARVNPLIKEVIYNLLDNAVKHSGNPVKIGITVDRAEKNGLQYHRVSIEDDGPGIPDEKKEVVFHRLKRGQTKARGTGLGLYLVKTLVESFDGIVELDDRVEGDYSQGCRFIVYLPVVGGDTNGK